MLSVLQTSQQKADPEKGDKKECKAVFVSFKRVLTQKCYSVRFKHDGVFSVPGLHDNTVRRFQLVVDPVVLAHRHLA